jgi:hypothetical protein
MKKLASECICCCPMRQSIGEPSPCEMGSWEERETKPHYLPCMFAACAAVTVGSHGTQPHQAA